MKVLVTGATGFLGAALARRLQADGHEVLGLGRNRAMLDALTAEGLPMRALDLSDAAGVADACRGQDAVLHCAALSSPWGRYEQFHAANVVGTRHVLDGCRQAGVGRLVNVSTPSIYFDHTDRFDLKEDAPLPRGVNAYAVTKLEAERLVAASGVPAVSLRPRGIFGPGDTVLVPRLLAANARGMLPVIGREDPLLDLTYVDNVVDAIVLAMTAPAAVGHVYNITNGEPVRLREMLGRLFALLGQPMRGKRMSKPGAYAAATLMEIVGRLRDQEPVLTRYTVGILSCSMTLDIAAARRDLGYAPRVSMDEGLARFAAWWQAQENP